ncbi:MAG: glutamine synthetase III, partial [Deltaproteobacteria bacterium]|nr:glutamine synthetase III [Deltaproteobacteria bacterium]
MSAQSPRTAVRASLAINPPALPTFDTPPPAELFGRDIFSHKLMRERLPKSVFQRLLSTIENDDPISPSDADVIASAMKDWAIERGATHFT